MERWARVLPTSAAALVILVGLAAPAAPAAAAPVADPQCSAAPALGLDNPEVSALARDRRISAAEAADRLRAQFRGAELAERGRAALGADFGGFWFQVDRDDRLAIGVVGGKQAALARRVAEGCGLGSRTDVVPVTWPFAQLKQAVLDLSATIGQANAGAPQSVGVSLLTGSNVVELEVPTDDKQLTVGQRAWLSTAQSRYGTMLRVRHTDLTGGKPSADCSVAIGSCDAPLRGGVAFFYIPQDQQSAFCTLGFLARSRSDRKLYAITAGHCVYDPTASHDFRNYLFWARQPRTNNFHVVGTPHNSYFNYRGDAAIISVDNPGPTGWAARAWVWVRPPESPTQERYKIGDDRPQDDMFGKRLCHTGLRSGTTCGNVTAIFASHRYDGYPFTMISMMKSDACNAPGDSGGPHFGLGVAYGIHSGAGGCLSVIQPVTQAENILNVDVSHEA